MCVQSGGLALSSGSFAILTNCSIVGNTATEVRARPWPLFRRGPSRLYLLPRHGGTARTPLARLRRA